MRRPTNALQLLGIVLIVLLAWPQLAGAQRLKPIAHPIGVLQHPPAQAQAEAHAEASVAGA